MTTFNQYTTVELINELNEFVNLPNDYEDDPIPECVVEGDENWSRAYTLGFYNFMVGTGAAVLPFYRQFDHLLLTKEQAEETLEDALFELMNMVNDNKSACVDSFELNGDEATVYMSVEFDGRWYPYDAHIWVERVEDTFDHKVDVISNDFYWEAMAA